MPSLKKLKEFSVWLIRHCLLTTPVGTWLLFGRESINKVFFGLVGGQWHMEAEGLCVPGVSRFLLIWDTVGPVAVTRAAHASHWRSGDGEAAHLMCSDDRALAKLVWFNS